MVPHFTPSGSSEPPRNRVVAFAEPTPGELWVGVYQVGLQQYFAASNTWATIGLNWWNQCLTSFAITPNKMVLGGNCDDLHCAIIDRQTGRRKGIGIDNYVQPMKASPSWANQVVFSMAPDGDKLWLGGVNYLALVDLRTETVERLAEFGNPDEYLEMVRGLQVVGQDLWVAVQNELFHLPRSTWTRNLAASK